MKEKDIQKIEKLLKDTERLIGDALLRFKFEVGRIIKENIDSGKAKSIDNAADELGDLLEKKYGRTYGSKYWRECYYTAVKLTEQERELILRKHIKPSQVRKIITKPQFQIEGIIKAIRNGSFRGFPADRYRVTNNVTNRARSADPRQGIGDNAPIIFPPETGFEHHSLPLTALFKLYAKDHQTLSELILCSAKQAKIKLDV